MTAKEAREKILDCTNKQDTEDISFIELKIKSAVEDLNFKTLVKYDISDKVINTFKDKGYTFNRVQEKYNEAYWEICW